MFTSLRLGKPTKRPNQVLRRSGIGVRRFLLACTVLGLVLGIACQDKWASDNSSSTPNQSPLATWNASQAGTFLQSSSGEGTLDISSRCVRLITRAGRRPILLVWPEPPTWNAPTQSIQFVSPFGDRLELRNGAQIAAGGATADDPVFVNPPDSSCEANEMFVLHSIRVVTE